MSEENERLFRRWVEELWNQKRESVVDELFAADGLAVCPNNPLEKPVRGIENFKKFFRHRLSNLLNFNITIEHLISAGDKITALCTVSAIKVEKNNSRSKIEVLGLYIVKFAAGKIIEAWHGFDFDKRYKNIDDLLRPAL